MRSYRPDELFGADGGPRTGLLRPGAARRPAARRDPARERRRCCCATWSCPTSATTRCRSPAPGGHMSEPTRVLGGMLRDVMRLNERAAQFPDRRPGRDRVEPAERAARGHRQDLGGGRRCRRRPEPRARRPGDGDPVRAHLPGLARGLPADRQARPVLLLRGVHPHRGLDVQPARQVAEGVAGTLPWRRPVASLNILLTSHVWRQDHNGFSHQDPGFIDHVMNKKAEVIRVYLPPDTNTLLSVADHCLRSRDYVNVIVAGKQPNPDWLDMDAAVLHCTRGAGSGSGPAATATDSRARRCARLRRRRANPGGARRHRHPARRTAGPAGPGRQRGGPDAAAAGRRASARDERRRVQRAVHRRTGR